MDRRISCEDCGCLKWSRTARSVARSVFWPTYPAKNDSNFAGVMTHRRAAFFCKVMSCGPDSCVRTRSTLRSARAIKATSRFSSSFCRARKADIFSCKRATSDFNARKRFTVERKSVSISIQLEILTCMKSHATGAPWENFENCSKWFSA